MRWFAILGLVTICGCTGSSTRQQAGLTSQTEKQDATSTAPVIVEATITGGGGGSKYYWYDVKPLKTIRNTIAAELATPLKVAIQNDMPEVVVGKTYVLNMVYYNESNPEYGLKIVSFKEK